MTKDPKIRDGAPPDGADEAGGEDVGGEEGSFPQHAFFSPDDPIARPEGEIPGDALFPPDGPLRQEEAEEGIVTPLSGDLNRLPDTPPSLVWKIRLTADLLEGLARELREQGLGALKVRPDSEPVDAMIRGFVAGYLVAQIEEEGR